MRAWACITLNFDSRESIAGIPSNPSFDYLDYAATLGHSRIRWTLVTRAGTVVLAGDPSSDAAEVLAKLRAAGTAK